SRSDRVDADLIEAFLSATFGRRHHVTSLFRYALSAKMAEEQNLYAESQSSVFDPSQSYQLGSHIRMLADMHDCGFLLERIRCQMDNSSLLQESETGERCAYLI